MENDNKVYVIVDDCVWDDDNCTKVVGVSKSEKIAKLYFQEYVRNIKEELNFDNLDFSENEYICEEDDKKFLLYLDGEYNSFHTEIYINECELINEKDLSDKYELSV